MNIKQFITLALSLVMSMSIFAQKNELKAAEKAIKKKDFPAAVLAISQAEGFMDNVDGKTMAKYYYLKGIATYADGTASSDELDIVVESFNSLAKVEKENGSSKYTSAANEITTTIIQKLTTDSYAAYLEGQESKDKLKYAEAADGYHKIYLLQPVDTSFLYNSAMINAVAANYEKSNEQYMELLDLGYTGITTLYSAKSMLNGEKKSYNSSKEMMSEVKLKLAEDPITEVLESKEIDMIKAIAANYGMLKDDDKALEFISIARKTNPNDYNLVIEEANIYFRKGENAKFKEKLEEAISLNPTDKQLYYNVGVMSMELDDMKGAKKNFEKCIELDAEYGDAYNAMGNLILKDVAAVQEEMNANGGNFKKYDEIKENKLYPILKEALPYLEKAYALQNDEIISKQLNSIYENLGMDKRID